MGLEGLKGGLTKGQGDRLKVGRMEGWSDRRMNKCLKIYACILHDIAFLGRCPKVMVTYNQNIVQF